MPIIGKFKHNPHRQFMEALAKSLMTYHKVPEHNQIRRSTRAYCVYCQKNQFSWEPKHQQRSFEADITNTRNDSGGGYGSRFRESKTPWGCHECNIALYKQDDC